MALFRTPVDVPEGSLRIDYNSKLMFIGSCFSEYIGSKFLENKFKTDNNPFGVIYNPYSINNALQRLINRKLYQTDELFQHNDIWYSFDHHGKFSGVDKNLVYNNINNRLINSSDFLRNTDFLFITFGTSFIYELKSTKKVVSNCHKVTSDNFEQRILTIEEITNQYSILLSEVFNYNPDIKVIFSVSPVRHWKNGAHGNQISKSILLLSIEYLCKSFQNTLYFPSYEILLDDLRDYRFYCDDMLHPNTTAINYIWEKIKSCFFEKETLKILDKIEQIVQAYKHKPFNPDSIEYKDFAINNLNKIIALKDKYNIWLIEEEEYFKKFS